MLDDLRSSASAYSEEPPPQQVQVETPRPQARQQSTFLGMTAPQRFILALLLFLMTCVCGTFALLIFEKVVPPFF